MMKQFPFVVCVLTSLNLVGGYRILGLIPFHARTHFIMFEPLLKELAARGHEVDVFGHYPQKEKIPRYNDLSIRGTLPMILGTFKFEDIRDNNFIIWYPKVLSEYGLKICENAFNTSVAKQIRDNKVKYDLIIIHLFLNDCMYGFAHHLQAPVLAISSNADFPWGSVRLGNPTNPSYIPVVFLPYENKMSFIQRFWNTIYYIGTVTYYNIYAMHYGNQIMQNFFGYQMPHLTELVNNYTSLILTNTHHSINYISPKTPNYIEVAGLHLLPPKPLPENFKRELEIEDKFRGVIYVSFGSLLAAESFPWNVLKGFTEAFASLPYKVIWKAEAGKLPKNLSISSNVFIQSWMPQQDILCHPNVKVFVTHGGLMSTQESIFCGVPMLGLPVFADQNINTENSKSKGFALKLKFEDVNREVFLKMLLELLENPTYKENAKKYSKLFTDRPQKPLETAVYWSEYIMHYKGAPHLQSLSAKLSWYQYFLLDILTLLGFITFCSISIMNVIVKSLKNMIRKKQINKMKTT